ncbi:GNAT family N-acetyltransferase [Bacillus lacus]|uniref:GNAT family N-acetyltransferase n=1 Tax=Metabacillus lacus TaxID=1983721 RepID=A0A7X2J295_9BACI|nr:GNAT family N-acetyltransferase [Metabacillus lacus]
MNYIFSVLTQEQAEKIAYSWRYEDEYSFYNMDSDLEDLKEFLNPESRGDAAFAVSADHELIAFLTLNKTEDTIVEIGLGMEPDSTGIGRGLAFVNAAIEFVIAELKPRKITLSVATFNRRAINVYRKAGFESVQTYMQNTNGKRYEFLKMIYIC